TFNVSWTGQEYALGATVYNVYVSDNLGSYTLWQSNTTQTSASYAGQIGHNYRFYCVYTDDDGNQAPSALASTTVKVTPTISWNNPADITYGTALSATQLNASVSAIVGGSQTSVAGTFTYSPLAGTVLNVGQNQTLSVTFTPTNTANFTSATANVVINV